MKTTQNIGQCADNNSSEAQSGSHFQAGVPVTSPAASKEPPVDTAAAEIRALIQNERDHRPIGIAKAIDAMAQAAESLGYQAVRNRTIDGKVFHMAIPSLNLVVDFINVVDPDGDLATQTFEATMWLKKIAAFDNGWKYIRVLSGSNMAKVIADVRDKWRGEKVWRPTKTTPFMDPSKSSRKGWEHEILPPDVMAFESLQPVDSPSAFDDRVMLSLLLPVCWGGLPVDANGWLEGLSCMGLKFQGGEKSCGGDSTLEKEALNRSGKSSGLKYWDVDYYSYDYGTKFTTWQPLEGPAVTAWGGVCNVAVRLGYNSVPCNAVADGYLEGMSCMGLKFKWDQE